MYTKANVWFSERNYRNFSEVLDLHFREWPVRCTSDLWWTHNYWSLLFSMHCEDRICVCLAQYHRPHSWGRLRFGSNELEIRNIFLCKLAGSQGPFCNICNFSPSMDELLHPLYSMVYIHLSIEALEWVISHPALCNGCNYLSMLGLIAILVTKPGSRWIKDSTGGHEYRTVLYSTECPNKPSTDPLSLKLRTVKLLA